MAAAGSAVGLGNIWRFPYLTGENGGGAFLLVYIVCVLLVGLPVMFSEFVIGRRSGKNALGAMRALSGSRRWDWLGWSCSYPSEGSRDELQQGSRLPRWLFLCWLWAIRIPVPVAIFIIFLHGLGIV